MTGPASTEPALPAPADPRRWITLVIILTAVLMAALDSTVLNVAIPTILRDFETTLPRLQWVITGYSLTFAALLIIGGRLADIHGARRVFMIGAAIFGVGSLVAALSTGVVMLVVGEAIVEGIGASLMLPATLGILTSSFQGQERATAFAAWGAVLGVAVALGAGHRWVPHDLLLVALGLHHQRDRRAVRHRRRGDLHARSAAPGTTRADRSAGRAAGGVGDAPARLRDQRGRNLRVVAPARAGEAPRRDGLVPRPPGRDRADRVPRVRDPAHGVRAGRAREGALATRSPLRVQHPAPARLPLRARDARGARDGSRPRSCS